MKGCHVLCAMLCPTFYIPLPFCACLSCSYAPRHAGSFVPWHQTCAALCMHTGTQAHERTEHKYAGVEVRLRLQYQEQLLREKNRLRAQVEQAASHECGSNA